MSNEITRAYKGGDAEMLTAIAAITQAAIENKTALIAKRTSWADPFLTNLETELEAFVIMPDHLYLLIFVKENENISKHLLMVNASVNMVSECASSARARRCLAKNKANRCDTYLQQKR